MNGPENAMQVPDNDGCQHVWITFEIADKTVDPEERRYVRYYQWVCFCLFFQVRITLAFRLQMIHSGLSLKTFLIG